MDDVFKALADPSRRMLLDSLNDRNGQTLRDLCAPVGMARQSVSKHLAVLEAAHLVTTTRHGREKRHFLNAAPINAIADRWLSNYDRRRATALADLKTALEHPMNTDTDTALEHPMNTDTGLADAFVYVTYIDTTPERLWQALTDTTFIRRYWGIDLISDWKAGSPITWAAVGATIDDPDQKVLESDPPRLLSYTWHAITPEFGEAVGIDPAEIALMAAEDRSTVTFEIEPAGGATKLTVTHTGFRPGSAIRASVSNGWPGILASLKTLLETGTPLAIEP